MKLQKIGEFGLISRLRGMLSFDKRVLKGIGDDCAVLRSGKKNQYDLLTIDTIVEGVHFASKTPPARIGRKALAVNISDIAAMGGTPSHAVVSLGIPDGCTVEKIRGIYRGMRKVAREFDVNIVGGDTVRSRERLVITISLMGTAKKDKIACRSGARPGDQVFVTGTLGGSILGRHLTFTPRIEQARFLVGNFSITSMIDLSDGLASDIRRICEESRVGVSICAGRIPVSPAARKSAAKSGKTPLESALTDGEDFELLFTVPKNQVDILAKKWKKRFMLKLTNIGEITKASGLTIKDSKGNLRTLEAHGYDHFR